MFMYKPYTNMMKGQSLIVYLVTMLIVSCTSSSSFRRDLSMENKNIGDELAEVQTFLNLGQCARECYNNASCESFLHNQDGGRCHLRIPVINKGRVLYVEGLVEGSRIEFDCDDYYFPASVAGICNISGSWDGLDPACHQNKGDIEAEGKLFPGACAVIIGTPTAETRFTIRLRGPPPDEYIHMRMEAHFNWVGEINQIVLQPKWPSWGYRNADSTIWPFAVNQEFNLTICAEATLYRIFVDGVEVNTNDYPGGSPTDVVRINVSYDVIIRNVHFIGYSD